MYIAKWKNWCFWTVVLEKTLESPLDCKEIQPVHPKDQCWKDWCWSWNSNTLATWYEELIHLKRPWCWERLRAWGEGGNRGWDDWMASLIQMDTSLDSLREMVKDRETWYAAVHVVAKSQTWLSDWSMTIAINYEAMSMSKRTVIRNMFHSFLRETLPDSPPLPL